MSNNGAKPFENNWAYLKTELRWLDRLLMLAVSRQRQDDKTLNRVANTPADKVTSHWWKGIISVNRGIDDREGPPQRSTPQATTSVSYSQHLEDRIQASYKAGVALALPELRDRFSLTEVEKNILLLAIAPEVNRRYGRLYDYLQEDAGTSADLPTIDLCLRLLCRNDYDWQQARARLTAPDSLLNRGLVEWIGDEDGTLLSQQVRVTDAVANYLLADVPSLKALQFMLDQTKAEDPLFLTGQAPEAITDAVPVTASNEVPDVFSQPRDRKTPPVLSQQVETAWEQLVLPQKLIRQLQYLSRQATQRRNCLEMPGLIVLFVGASGTGKTVAAGTIAAHLGIPLTCVDLETFSPESYPTTLTDAPTDDPSLLLVKQGENWFGRKPQVDQTWLHQWWQWRIQFYGLTLVTTQTLQGVRPSWRQRFDGVLTFPRPDTKARRRLWEQSLPTDLEMPTLDWAMIATQLSLTGGEIKAIAQTIQMDLQAREQSTLTLSALKEAILLHHPYIDISHLKRKEQTGK